MAKQCENCDQFLKPENAMPPWAAVDQHFDVEPAQERERVPAAKVKVRDDV